MNLKTEGINKNFSSFAKLLHWGFVILFLYGLLKQIDSINQLEDDNLLMFEVIFALAFLLLLIIQSNIISFITLTKINHINWLNEIIEYKI